MPQNNAAALLASRWEASPATVDLDSLFKAVIDAIEKPGVKHDQLVKAGKLTKSGVSEAVRDHASKTYLSDLGRAVKAVETGRAELQHKRQTLSQPATDKNDLVAAHLRSEARSRLLALKPTERQAVLSQGDTLFIQAIAEAPALMSGITETTRNEMTQLYLRTHHEKELAELDQRQEALDALGAATQIALGELRSRAGLTAYERQYDGPPDSKDSKPLQSFDAWFDREAGLAPKTTTTNGSTHLDAIYDRLKAEAVAEIARL